MDIIDSPTPGSNTPEFTVSEIGGAVKKLVENELGWVRIRGEVGRVVQARSGHLYFDLKDDRSVLACMSWKGQVPGLGLMPEEGMEVVAEGKMTASGFQSKFALNAQRIAVAGEGALMAMLEKRKKMLAAEGLFDESRKRALPYLPDVIGVVTSLQGAVIRDILHRLRDRFPRKVLIWPVAVQGEKCAPDVARAIAGFNAMSPGGALPRPDLLIVARGGGSVEDLWGFNEEVVARAVAVSDIALISAVGHETDTTLIDFVSDVRAPTPTAAAELAVPVRHELMAWLDGQDARMRQALSQGLTRRDQRLRDLGRALPRPESLLEAPSQRLDVRAARLGPALMTGVQRRKVHLADISGSLRPATLGRAIENHKTHLHDRTQRLGPALLRTLAIKHERLDGQLRRFRPQALARDTQQRRQKLNDVCARLSEAGHRQIASWQSQVEGAERLRRTLGYEATLERGFAVVRTEGIVVTDSKSAQKAASLEIQFADGRISVGNTGKMTRPRPNKTTPKKPDQGSLF